MSVLPSPSAREMVCGPPFDCLTLVLMVYYLDLVSHLVAVSSGHLYLARCVGEVICTVFHQSS